MEKIPPELLNLIFSFITDTETYKNTRLTCNLFRMVLLDVNVYSNKKLDSVYKFDYVNKEVKILDDTGGLVGYILCTFPPSIKVHSEKKDEYILEELYFRRNIIKKKTTFQQNLRFERTEDLDIATNKKK